MKRVNAEGKKSKFLVYLPLAIVIVVVIVGGYYWYRDYSRYISTDDAYIDADRVSVSSKIPGRIVNILADEGDTVTAGKLLVELDSLDMLAQKRQVVSQVALATANLTQTRAKYGYDEKNITVLVIARDRAKDDLARASTQFAGGVITQEQYDHLKKAFESAQAQLDAATAQLDVARGAISSAEAAVQASRAQLQVVEVELTNTKVYAPHSGMIARRWLLPGDVVQPGQSVMTITQDSLKWVLVYLQETNLEGIKIGQKAIYTVDAFPGLEFEGKVFYIGSNTASQFSLIPPSNASGNFTKVTQRVPLKISFDKATKDGVEVPMPDLLAGMSVVVKIVR
ncbi:MAG TPA: HlyD family secretion protein [Williamwhitmania sp.]|nr:HlyD family secretion protein [Williamwhitmania sp.]